MIDYVKILITNPDIKKIKEHKSLNFIREVSENTGECKRKIVAEYHFCKITIYDNGTVLFTGSIHKLYNSLKETKAPNYNPNNYKGFNGNLFTLENILEAKTHLLNLLSCQPQQMVFQNIEFGINTTPLFCPQTFIIGLMYQKGKSFEFKYNRHYGQVEHKRYRIKIYNKSKQYRLNENTLRIEIGCKKSIDFACTGIRTFEDINTVTLNNALELLLNRFDEVVYFDRTIDKTKLTKRQKTSIKNYSNITYWLDTLKPNKRDEHKKNLKQIIVLKSQNLQAQLKENLRQKGVIINRLSKKQSRVIINSSSIGLNITQNSTQNKDDKAVRKCAITGINISMQKEESKLLSHTGLKFYLKNDKKTFDEVLNKFLTTTWINSNSEIQIKELAHNIRNKYYNRSRSTNPLQKELF